MNSKNKKLLNRSLVLLAFFLWIIPILVLADTGDYGLSSISGLPTDEPGAYANKIIQYAVGLVGIILVVFLIYGGFLYLTSGGKEQQAGKAKTVITYAIFGTVVLFAAYIIAKYVIDAVTGGSTGGGT